jgi:uncharacterized membrane protein SirB2
MDFTKINTQKAELQNLNCKILPISDSQVDVVSFCLFSSNASWVGEVLFACVLHVSFKWVLFIVGDTHVDFTSFFCYLLSYVYVWIISGYLITIYCI